MNSEYIKRNEEKKKKKKGMKGVEPNQQLGNSSLSLRKINACNNHCPSTSSFIHQRYRIRLPKPLITAHTTWHSQSNFILFIRI